MDVGTATHKLKKIILFNLLQQLNKDYCFRCDNKIEILRELSIEHKQPWLDSDNPLKLFFDLNNIAFSHLSCNCSAARQSDKKYFTELEKQEAKRKGWRESQKRTYTPEKRRTKYLTKGY